MPRHLSANRALAEANKIITDLTGDDVIIDWSRDPLSDREAKVRLAIIRRVEIMVQERRIFNDSYFVWSELDLMAPNDHSKLNRPLGRDLLAALEKWDRLREEETEARRANTSRQLIDLAYQDVNGESLG